MSRPEVPLNKRKAASDATTERTATKRPKTEPSRTAPARAPQKVSMNDDEKPAKAVTKSLFSKEQPAFPRGGASLLTPLEKKQIDARAWRDAQKEATGQSTLFDDGQIAVDISSDDDKVLISRATDKSKKGIKAKATEKSKTTHAAKATKIGGLSYKRLEVGSVILGQVAAISDRDMTIALPNQLTGYVPITAVSKPFGAKIQRLVETDVEVDNDDDEVELRAHFSVGQFVRTAVTSLGHAGSVSGGQARKHVELSLEPVLVNAGLSRASLVPGVTVQAAVQSVEDHGLVVDLDLDGEESRGFVPTKSLPEGKSLDGMKEGTVLLCQVAKNNANSKVVSLSANLTTSSKAAKLPPSVDVFLPGTLAEILVTEVQDSGLVGKIMGMLTVTADLVHSGATKDKGNLTDLYEVGSKIRGRMIYKIGPTDDCKAGFSVINNITKLDSATAAEHIKIGSIIENTTVLKVEPGLGLYMDLGSSAVGFAHISRLADGKVETISPISGPFKAGSSHKARITDFSPIDSLYSLSLEQSVLEQRYLRLEDVSAGDKVTVKIEKALIGPSGIKGLIVKISNTISGFVPDIHLSDAVLANPEKKFREGASIKTRVLLVDLNKRQIRLTAKRTLVNTDAKLWTSYADVKEGESSVGTLVNVEANGALVQFFGDVKGFLPVAEMSEAYIKDAREHFRVGQVLTLNVLNIKVTEKRLTVSCRESKPTATASGKAVSLETGSLVNGTIFEKSADDVMLRLDDSDTIARLSVDHCSDGSFRKRQSVLGKLRVGQKLEGLLLLDVQPKRKLAILCNRKALIKAAADGTLLRSFEGLEVGKTVTGFVSNITSDGAFISFASRISGLITPRNFNDEQAEEVDFGLTKLQTVTSKISSIDLKGATPRFWLTLKEQADSGPTKPKFERASGKVLVDPVDKSIDNESQLNVGTVTKARIVSVKESQLNVELAKDTQGRVDVSEIYDSWEDIKDRKKPLQKFGPKQIIDVKILGAHDTRTHRFLPLSHRQGKTTVYELTAKPHAIASPGSTSVSYHDLKPGDSHIAFVNNIDNQYIWVNISPSARGRIKNVDLADDLSIAANIETNFPIGSCIRARVIAVDADKGRLDLTGRTSDVAKSLTINDVSVGQILAGRVTKISDRQIILSLSDTLAGAIDLIDIADDYKDANTAAFQKNEIVRACVVRVDQANKHVYLSTRSSKILSSSLPVADPEVTSVAQLEVNDICRGFIRNVDDKGVFVMLGHGVTAYVRVSHLSDAYLKDWKDSFQRDQLVKGKIISLDKSSGHLQMSLKESIIASDYTPPIRLADIKVDDVVTGKVAKVEEFGVFIVVDNSEKIRGLCHRSEIAEKRIEDARKLFNEGDAVKAKVLKVDLETNRINFGLKASYFDEVNEDTDSDIEDDEGVAAEELGSDGHNDEMEGDGSEVGGALLDDSDGKHTDPAQDTEDLEFENDAEDEEHIEEHTAVTTSLNIGGFDWHGLSSSTANKRSHAALDDTGLEDGEKPKKRKKRAEIEVDRTGDLDSNGPQSADDFERLLLGDADSSILWLQYMAFYIDLGDVDQARKIAERALKSIGLGQDMEKQNIWVALLNLEVEFGDDNTLDAAFQRACEYNDPQEMHTRLTSILIHAHKYDKADGLFQTMLKKYTQDPKVWINYATFLFDTKGDADKARDVLPRALQTLPKFTHLDITSKFAQFEFKSEAGVAERGRTIFEGLISSFPKRIDLYNILLDLEVKDGDSDQVRALFERIFTRKLKPKQAKYFFKRWLEYEEGQGDVTKAEAVKEKAAAWLRSAGKEK